MDHQLFEKFEVCAGMIQRVSSIEANKNDKRIVCQGFSRFFVLRRLNQA